MTFPLREQPKVAHITFAYIPLARNQSQTNLLAREVIWPARNFYHVGKRGEGLFRDNQRPLLSALLSPWWESLFKEENNTEEGREEGCKDIVGAHRSSHAESYFYLWFFSCVSQEVPFFFLFSSFLYFSYFLFLFKTTLIWISGTWTSRVWANSWQDQKVKGHKEQRGQRDQEEEANIIRKQDPQDLEKQKPQDMEKVLRASGWWEGKRWVQGS